MMNESKTRTLLLQSLVVVLLWLVWVLLMAWSPEPFANPFLRGLVRIGILLLPAIWYVRQSPYAWLDGWYLRQNWRRGVLVGLAVGTAVITFFYLAQYQQADLAWQLPAQADIWFNWILGSPFAEEVWFRAVLFSELKRTNGLWTALLGSSFMFALLHLPTWILLEGMSAAVLMQSFGNIFLYGLVFAFLLNVTGSLWAALLPHWLNNLFLQGFSP